MTLGGRGRSFAGGTDWEKRKFAPIGMGASEGETSDRMEDQKSQMYNDEEK